MGKTILLVNDEEAVLETASKALTEKGYQVERHRHSWDTLFAFYKTPSRFDLVITDQSMADISGLALAEKLLNLRPRMPIVLLVSEDREKTESRARAAGFHWFVSKPVSKDELLSTVRQALKRPRYTGAD